jgi:NAD-reducing hydrogenase small subunit
MNKVKLATCWLDGCSGCHMSLLDIDEGILKVLELADIVYGPLVDIKEFPEDVDVALVEGAVSSVEDLEKIRTIRERTRILVALGDCAVTSNVPSMRNQCGVPAILERAYLENVTLDKQIPNQVVPQLLPKARPLHDVVKIDVFIPGCPPSAQIILNCVAELCAGRLPEPSLRYKFG